MIETRTNETQTRTFLIWGVAALFYIYQYILRVAPSVMVDHLMLDLQTTATGIGSLSAITMYFYAICQIPAGVLIDGFGTRRVTLSAWTLCIVGTFLVSLSMDLHQAQLGRILSGVGAAPAFLCLTKLSSQNLSRGRQAFLFGAALSLSTVGVLSGGPVLAFLVKEIGWRQALWGVCGVGSMILFIYGLLNVQVVDQRRIKLTHAISLGSIFLQILSNKLVWAYSFIAACVYVVVAVLADLWGLPFLMQKYGLEKTSAAQGISLIYIGLFFGSIVITSLSDRVKKCNRLIQLSTSVLTGLLLVLINSPTISFFQSSGILFLLGIFSGVAMVCFLQANQTLGDGLAGTAAGFINTAIILIGALGQHLVGVLLDLNWQGGVVLDGIREYSTENFQVALICLPIFTFSALICSFFLPSEARK